MTLPTQAYRCLDQSWTGLFRQLRRGSKSLNGKRWPTGYVSDYKVES